MDGIVTVWNAFYQTQNIYLIELGKPEWQNYLNSIVQNMSELDRLRRILLVKQEHFECKLRNVSFRYTLPRT